MTPEYWQLLLRDLVKRGASREIDEKIHVGLGMPAHSQRIIPKYGRSCDASQRVLIQIGANWRLQVNDGVASAFAQAGDAWLDAKGPIDMIAEVQCRVMLMALAAREGT